MAATDDLLLLVMGYAQFQYFTGATGVCLLLLCPLDSHAAMCMTLQDLGHDQESSCELCVVVSSEYEAHRRGLDRHAYTCTPWPGIELDIVMSTRPALVRNGQGQYFPKFQSCALQSH